MRTSILSNSIVFLGYLSQIALVTAQPGFLCAYCNNTNGNYTSNSTYIKNMNRLFGLISSNTQINNWFYNVSYGQDPDKIFAIAVCRADHSPADCRTNVNNAIKVLPYDCPVQKEAIGYYSNCMFRYSNRPIFKILENSPNCTFHQSSQNMTVSELGKQKEAVGNLLERLRINASHGNSSYKFSNGVEQVKGSSKKIYALAQCKPDFSSSECSDCLEGVTSGLKQCCSTMNGVASYGPVCSIEYANYPLLSAVANSSLQPILPASTPVGSENVGIKSGHNRGSSYRTWIIFIGVVSLLVIATLSLVLSRRKMRKNVKQEEGNDGIKLEDSLQLDFSTIQFATDNFSDAHRLGDDNAIAMYKGVLLDGQEIAVKKLYKGSRDSELEFDNEVLLSANLQHKNLVKLLGFCIEKDLRFLVYEFLHNGSLQGFLDDPVKRASLDWQTRYHIISGLARGLLYLHEDSQVRVIHRDLKPRNILLGVHMDAKITNFRTASLIQGNQTRGDSRVFGTYGYMPLEYVQHGHSSIKSDIFSYGVILLEIITGYTISGFSDEEKEESLLTYVWRKWRDGIALDVVDKALPNVQRHVNQIQRCIKMALLCVQEDLRQRPTMSTVVLMLNTDTVDITDPMKPGPLVLNDIGLHSDYHSTQTDISHQDTSLNEASVSYLDPR